MDALDLIRTWPTWKNAGSGKIISSPAWRLDVMFADRRGVLRTAPEVEAEERLWLEIKLDDERHYLGISDAVGFPELHKIWRLRDGLPSEVLMALVERDCSSFFQMLEDVLHMQFSVVGFVEGVVAAPLRSFEVVVPGEGDDDSAFGFAMDFSAAMEIDLGRLENLDVDHESIREMSREVEAEYAEIPVSDDDVSGIADGDLLLRPEEQSAHWVVELPSDDAIRILGAERKTLTFAQLADGGEPVPDTDAFRIFRGGREIATAVPASVGSHPAYKVV